MKLLEVSDRPTNNLSDTRGFALIETIVALAILSFVLLGLMVMVQYARARAITNYHDRYVLYRVEGELQKIKARSMAQGQSVHLPGNVQFTIPHSVNPSYPNSQPIRVTIRFSTQVHRDERFIPEPIFFTAVTAIAEWNEHRGLGTHRRLRAERRYIQLREDYFFRSSGHVL
jgi:prepilin-type N-terminal cleavage/methylation domain-containing protein